VVAVGGVAYATIPDSSGTIHGCFNNANGNLRVVQSASDCRTGETAIEWNQQGRPGPPGSSNVLALPTTLLSDGETKSLFDRGPLTFTAHCGYNAIAQGISSGPVDIAEVLVS